MNGSSATPTGTPNNWYRRCAVTATKIHPVEAGFRVEFAEVTARQVVIATGVLPYAYIPDELSSLPPELVTHASEHHDLSRFKGRRVAVLGAGQSALETSALLHELGADVQVVARTPALR